MYEDQYHEKFFKGYKLSVFKSSSHDRWTLYIDNRIVHDVSFFNKKDAFSWLQIEVKKRNGISGKTRDI